jgi:hypothetical protein
LREKPLEYPAVGWGEKPIAAIGFSLRENPAEYLSI